MDRTVGGAAGIVLRAALPPMDAWPTSDAKASFEGDDEPVAAATARSKAVPEAPQSAMMMINVKSNEWNECSVDNREREERFQIVSPHD